MPSPDEVLSLIDKIRSISTDEDLMALIDLLACREKSRILSFLNAHAVNLCATSSSAMAAFQASDVILRDGVAVRAAMAALDRPPGRNMNGTDFIPALLGALPPCRLAVYGTAPPWLGPGAERLAALNGHTLVDAAHGFLDAGRYVAAARRTRPDVVVLAMGMPRQEEVAIRLKPALDHPVLIINGGAIVDFLGGRVDRAPVALRRLGLEWAFRLSREPKRLFRRYAVGAPAFARTVLRLRRLGPTPSAAHAHREP